MAATLHSLLADAVGNSHATKEGAVHVVRPGSPPEVARILAIARDKKVPLAPMGTGSIALGGPQPAEHRIVLDTRRMTNILHLDPLSLTVHAQAGISVGALEARLNQDGLTLGDFPAETYRSTLGGCLSARAPGRATSRLGHIESTCIGLSAVLADGRTVHVKAAPRRATGPDLMRLFLGSEGVLGIITAAVLRIWRLPDARLFATHALPSIDAAVEAARKVLRRGARPAAMRIYDADDAMATGLTEVDPHGQALLLATMTGHPEIVEMERRILESAVRDRGGTPLPAAAAEKWWRDRAGPQAPSATTPSGGGRFQAAAPLSRLGAVYRGVRASLMASGAVCSAFLGHFHEDGGSVYFSFPRTAENDAVAREAAVAAGGRPAAELGADEALMSALREMKKELDPQGTLYGGRLV
jgi:alkyldihydroxyacetonephosphate synthase